MLCQNFETNYFPYRTRSELLPTLFPSAAYNDDIPSPWAECLNRTVGMFFKPLPRQRGKIVVIAWNDLIYWPSWTIKTWEFDADTGAFMSHGPAFGNYYLKEIYQGAGGELWADHSAGDIKLLGDTYEYVDGESFPASRFGAIDIYVFMVDRARDRIVMRSNLENFHVGIYEFSSGALIERIRLPDRPADICHAEGSWVYILLVNKCIVGLDYATGQFFSYVKVPQINRPEYARLAYDKRVRRLLFVEDSADNEDGTSTMSIKGFRYQPRPVHVCVPIPLRRVRIGKQTPLLTKQIGDAGEGLVGLITANASEAVARVIRTSIPLDGDGEGVTNIIGLAEGTEMIQATSAIAPCPLFTLPGEVPVVTTPPPPPAPTPTPTPPPPPSPSPPAPPPPSPPPPPPPPAPGPPSPPPPPSSPTSVIYRPWADSEEWNAPIPSNAVRHDRTHAITRAVQDLIGDLYGNCPRFSIPVFQADASIHPMRSISVSAAYIGSSPARAGTVTIPFPPNAHPDPGRNYDPLYPRSDLYRTSADPWNQQQAGGAINFSYDGHMIIVWYWPGGNLTTVEGATFFLPAGWVADEFWHGHKHTDGSMRAVAHVRVPLASGDGLNIQGEYTQSIYGNWNNPNYWGHGWQSIRAYGGTGRGGLIMKDELRIRGRARHAIAVLLNNSVLRYSPSENYQGGNWIFPIASRADQGGGVGTNQIVPMGACFSLPLDFNVEALGSLGARCVADILKTHGMKTIDATGGYQFSIDGNEGYNDWLELQSSQAKADMRIITKAMRYTSW